MKKHSFCFLLALFFAFNVSAQNKAAELIDEFPTLNCEDLLARADNFASLLNKNPYSKLYVVFYEGKHPEQFYNKKEKKVEWKSVNPRHGEASNKTEAITFYLTKYRKISQGRFELIDGGYDTEYRVQVWLVPNSAEPPKPSPTLEEKDIKFRKGKAPKVADCQGSYNNI